MSKKNPAQEDTDTITHMSFEVPTKLRNAFKAKIASQGKTVREVMLAFLEEYVNDKK